MNHWIIGLPYFWVCVGFALIAILPYWMNAASMELRNAKKYGPRSWQ